MSNSSELNTIIDDNPHIPDWYQWSIDKQEAILPQQSAFTRASGTNFATTFYNFVKEGPNWERVNNLLSTQLVNRVFIDLGPGKNETTTYNLAKIYGVGLYVQVDLNQALQSNPKKVVAKSVEKNLTVIKVNCDMLRFVTSLRTNANVNFAVFGIDSLVIGDCEYHQLLADELIRVTQRNNLILGGGSSVYTHLRTNTQQPTPNMQKAVHITDYENNLPFFIYQKI